MSADISTAVACNDLPLQRSSLLTWRCTTRGSSPNSSPSVASCLRKDAGTGASRPSTACAAPPRHPPPVRPRRMTPEGTAGSSACALSQEKKCNNRSPAGGRKQNLPVSTEPKRRLYTIVSLQIMASSATSASPGCTTAGFCTFVPLLWHADAARPAPGSRKVPFAAVPEDGSGGRERGPRVQAHQRDGAQVGDADEGEGGLQQSQQRGRGQQRYARKERRLGPLQHRPVRRGPVDNHLFLYVTSICAWEPCTRGSLVHSSNHSALLCGSGVVLLGPASAQPQEQRVCARCHVNHTPG